MAQLTMIEAIRDALSLALDRDGRVLVFGEDVGKSGGVFRATAGLQETFGEARVFDTPLAESAIAGLATGLALQGFLPVAEIQFFGFVFEAMDEIVGQAARMRFRTGGRYHCPVVYRAPFGGGVKTPELHADSLEGLLAQSPGLKVVVPASPHDAKGLLLSAIFDEDPVFFLEHMKLYRSFREEVPEGFYTVPIGKANTLRAGTDLTLISYGAMVRTALAAAERVQAEQGISVEVIDLRTISPLDMETVVASIRKTHRALVLQEAPSSAGVAAEVIARINELAIYDLEGPVLRLAPPDTVYPFTQYEKAWLPDENLVLDRIEQALHA